MSNFFRNINFLTVFFVLLNMQFKRKKSLFCEKVCFLIEQLFDNGHFMFCQRTLFRKNMRGSKKQTVFGAKTIKIEIL